MKVPKNMKRYCKHCRKQTEQVLSIVHKSNRGSLKQGQRRKNRISHGHGDKGHYSRKPIKDWSRNSKVSIHKEAVLECTVCKKKSIIKGGYKSKKFEITK